MSERILTRRWIPTVPRKWGQPFVTESEFGVGVMGGSILHPFVDDFPRESICDLSQ